MNENKAQPDVACGNCSFYQPQDSDITRGLCRRYPHAAAVLDVDWCGEFKALPGGQNPPPPPDVRGVSKRGVG